jgi:formyl-CoA transferase
VRVLEVGVFMAAPFATMQLADLGADVLKVESPDTGEPVRSTGPFVAGESSPFLRLNRSKESVALDLKSDGGKAAFLRLAAQADVVVENLRPGAMRRLGLSYDDVRAVNPGVVYASASGFGQTGPLRDLPGLDIMAQARGGLLSITGYPDGPPAKVGVPVCDLVCGLYVALAVTAALRERDASGEGQYVDVSLLESGVSLAVWEAGRYFATGEVGRPLGSAHQSQAPYQAVRTHDGWVTLGAITPPTWRGMCAALELDELADDPRFVDSSSRHARRDELMPLIEARTATWDTAEVVSRLEEAGVPCAPIADYGEVFTDDHLEARDFFWEAPHPVAGPVRQVGSPMRFSRSEPRRAGAGPVLGSGTREALRAVGYSDEDVDTLVATGAVQEAT